MIYAALKLAQPGDLLVIFGDNITRAWKQIIYFKKAEGQTPSSYTMDHSAGSYLFDPAGRLRVYSRYGSGAEAVAADVRSLLKEAA